jgi:hypothetical protein
MLPALLLALSLWTPAVAVAVGADHLTTEKALRMGYVERNPLPGMQTLPGRLAWSTAQLGAIAWATHSKSPKVRRAGKAAAVVCIGVHLGAAYLNSRKMKGGVK